MMSLSISFWTYRVPPWVRVPPVGIHRFICFHKSQIYQTDTLQSYFPNKMHLNIIFPSRSKNRSSEWSPPFRLSNQYLVRISHLPMCATCPAHNIVLDFIIILIIFSKQCTLWCSSFRSFLQPPVPLFVFGSNILLSNLFSHTLNLCYSHNVTDQVSYRYKTTELYKINKTNTTNAWEYDK